jgi:polynucleotide 5'-kinase involved in rRNA processing
MKKVEEFLRRLYRRKIRQEYDAMFIVLGDEGVGKSTFMTEATGRWQLILAEHGYMDSDVAGTPDAVLSRLSSSVSRPRDGRGQGVA